jgi:hypothetical protein
LLLWGVFQQRPPAAGTATCNLMDEPECGAGRVDLFSPLPRKMICRYSQPVMREKTKIRGPSFTYKETKQNLKIAFLSKENLHVMHTKRNSCLLHCFPDTATTSYLCSLFGSMVCMLHRASLRWKI